MVRHNKDVGLGATGCSSASAGNTGRQAARATRRQFQRVRLPVVALICGVAVMLWPTPAYAMHISEGILPPSWAGLWFLVAAPFLAWGLHTVDRRRAEDPRYMVLVAMVGAAIFVISCMPVPIPVIGSCSHPCGTGLGRIADRPWPNGGRGQHRVVVPGDVLAHGGLTTLGANIVSMGVVGAFTAYGVFHLLRGAKCPWLMAAFFAGAFSDWATYATTSLELATALHDGGPMAAMFVTVLLAFVPTQLPLGIAEGFLTAVAYRFVRARRPELLGLCPIVKPMVGERA